MSKEDFILVKGDVSGIQYFIFNVKSKGAAQELKGRSFFIKILIQVAMHYLFDKAEIPIDKRKTYQISTSGGNFIIKLSKDKESFVSEAQKIFTDALRFMGLNICFASVDYNNTYSTCIQNLHRETQKNKKQIYTDIDFFISEERCKYTNISPKWPKVTQGLKTAITDQGELALLRMDENSENINITESGISILNYYINFKNEDNGTLIKRIDLNSYLESLFPKGASFEDFFKRPYSGAKKLAALKMDVDGLGAIVESLKSEENHKKLDHKLQYFFNSKLRELINWKFKDKVYTVVAGGDDSFFVGAWSSMLDLAIEINDAFNEEFKESNTTISAGFVIIDTKFPVIRFAQLAENAIKKAKYRYPKKGNICLFNEVIPWKRELTVYKDDTITPNKSNKTKINDLRMLKHLVGPKKEGDKEKYNHDSKWASFNDLQSLRDHLKNLKLSGSFLAKARRVGLNMLDKEHLSLQDFWEMGYYLRDAKGEKSRAISIIEKHLKASLNKDSTSFEKRTFKLIMPIAARLAELDNRKS